MEYKRQSYIDQLVSRKQNGLIKVITGSRRSGKSYILGELYRRYLLESGVPATHIIMFAFDMDEDIDLLDKYYPQEETRIKTGNGYLVNAKKFRAYIKDKTSEAGEYFILLDEVQLLDNFTGTLNGFLRNKKLDIYVTGSNSRFLSSDIATEFSGRGTVIHVLPLAFSEYMECSDEPVQKAWSEYIVTGGIPLVALMNTDQEKAAYLKKLCEETYLKDIISRHRIKKTAELADTFNIIASTVGAPVNVSKITKTFNAVTKKDLTDDTVSDFIRYFEEAFVISKAQKYSIKGRKYIGSPFKLYFEDVGVRNARMYFRQIEETHLMENILYNELRYRGFNVDVGEVEIREKTDRKDKNGKAIYDKKSLEVDFIASLGSQKYYVQSALSITDEEKKMQERRSLYYIDDSFKKIIVTKNGLKPDLDEKGVLIIDLFDFLTKPETWL